MFNLEKFHEDAYNGEKMQDIIGFCDYINHFTNVILWGAGNLGEAIGKKLQQLNLKIDIYWDAKFKEKKILNDVVVMEPFTGEFDKRDTLVIFCIANVPVAPALFYKLQQEGWKNTIKGLVLLQGMICPLQKGKSIDTGVCSKFQMCTVCSCERLSNLMKAKVMEQEKIGAEEVLSFDRVHFIINNFCNLKCTHCYMYMNSYPTQKKKNVEIQILRKDIELVMKAVHSFGVVNVFGGEPFLHPELNEIVESILKYDNFGALIVNTNGVAKMNEEQLRSMKDKRVRLAFSNYQGALSEKQQEQVELNFAHTQELEINAQKMNELPTWNISSTLCDNKIDEVQMKYKKDHCGVKFLYLFDHKLFPCSFALSLYDLGVADYGESYIDLDIEDTPQKLRDAIRKLFEQKYYRCCGHCDNMEITDARFANKAGEQGYSERYIV